MNWLLDFFKTACTWVLKNPLLVALIIIISLYNHYFSDIGVSTDAIDPFRADSIWAFTRSVLQFLFSVHGAIVLGLTYIATSILIMFNTGALFGVFAGLPRPAHVAFRTAFSSAAVDYFLLQVVATLGFGALFLLGMWLVVPVGGLTGLTGSIVIGACTAIAYPIFYIIVSTGSLILGTSASRKEELGFARVLFGKQNLPRLASFYLVRIGAEALVVYLVLILARVLHLPAAISGILVIIAVSIPFALVRTTGLVMKLDMLREVPWFASYFKEYYLATAHATVPAMPRGKLILVVGPSGSGKGTLIAHARASVANLRYSVSCTTRSPRPGETEGVQYHFLSQEVFEQKIAAGEFLEWAPYGGNYYGTLLSEVETALAAGDSIILEIEVQGARQVRARVEAGDVVTLFIDAGDWDELERRIRARAPIGDAELAKRKERYADEVSFMPEADFVIRNYAGQVEEGKAAFLAAVEGATRAATL